MKKSIFEMIALEEELNAYSVIHPDKYSGYMKKIGIIEKYLEEADIDDDIADAIDDAKEALEEKMFAEAHQISEEIRSKNEYKKYLETFEYPEF